MNSNTQKHKLHPRDNANIFSYFFYWYTKKLFKFSNKKNFTLEDLHDPLTRDQSATLGDALEIQWYRQRKKISISNYPSLLISIFITFRKHLTITVILHVISDVILSILSAFFLGELLPFFKSSPTLTFCNALIHAGALVLTNLMKFTCQNHSIFQACHIGGRIRVAVYSLVYKKSLRLSRKILNDNHPKDLVNSIMKDVDKLAFFWQYSNAIWATPLSALIIGYIIYLKIGCIPLLGIFLFILLTPLQIYIVLQSLKHQNQATVITNERIKILNELIRNADTIKIRAWEKPFYKLIQSSRKIEISILKRRACLQGLLGVLGLLSYRLALYVTVAALIFNGEDVSPEKIYMLVPFLLALADLSTYSAMGLGSFADCLMGLGRIQGFLELDESSKNLKFLPFRDLHPNLKISDKVLLEKSSQPSWSIKIDELSLICESSLAHSLEDVNLKFDKGKLYLLIEPGFDKSFLIAAILGEVKLLNGDVKINGNISYAGRNAWLFGGSVKDNILLGEIFDPQRYDKTIDICQLRLNLDRLPRGDDTTVRDDFEWFNAELRAKINLARAVYKRSDIILLDDPLSMVKNYFDNSIVRNCVVELSDRTRILATRRFLYLKEVDGIVYVDNNKVKYYNSYEEFFNEHIEFRRFIDVKKLNDVNVNDDNVMILQDQSDEIIKKEDETLDENVENCLLLKYFHAGSNLFFIIVMCILFVITQVLINFNDLYILLFTKALETNENSTDRSNHILNSFLKFEESYSITWNFYFYTCLIITISILALARTYLYYTLCFRSNKNLYNYALSSLMRTSIQFFHENSSKRVIDRLSKDIMIIDELLPRTLLDVTQIFLAYIGAIVIASLICPFFLVPALIVIALGYWTRKFYLRHVNDVRRVEEIAKARVFAHLEETIDGISTIKTCKAEIKLKNEFDQLQDTHTSAWYTLLTCKFAYSFLSRLLNCALITVVIFGFVIYKNYFDDANIGLAITQMMCTTAMISYASIMSGEVSHYLSSTERILEYTRLPPESKGKSVSLDKKKKWKRKQSYYLTSLYNWPFDGRLEFENVGVKSEENNGPVLRNINFIIRHREKVGIFGKGDSEKSLLINALFRLSKISGYVKIDGINTDSVLLETLRSQLSFVSRKPVLFSGTLRSNLDPFNEFSDNDIWQALNQVELKSLVAESQEGLNLQIDAEDKGYSVTQRQRISLARAILKKNSILVIEKANEDIEPWMDALIQRVIRTIFSECTVIILGYSPNAIIDFDKIIVMERGRVVEFDHPYNLLKQEDSLFKALVLKERNNTTFQQLYNLAEKNYMKNKRL